MKLLPSALLFILVLLLISTWLQCCSSSLCYIYVFFCFCMSYAKIELFTQWNKNILNDFRLVFSVDIFLSHSEEYATYFSKWIPFSQTPPSCIHYERQQCVWWVCMRAGLSWHAVSWCAKNRLSECVSTEERQQSWLGTHTTGVHCICGHMMPIRQIRAQTDEALLNGSFY